MASLRGKRQFPRVACLGDVFVDLQADGVSGLPEWGTDHSASAVRLLPGGSCANTARNLASICQGGISVSLFSTLGDDELGRFFLRRVTQEGLLDGVNPSLQLLPGVPQSCCIILSGMKPSVGAEPASADRAMVSCYSSTARLSVRECAPELCDDEWDVLHLGGYFNCPGIHTLDLLRLCERVRASGGIVSLDTQFDASGQWAGLDGHLSRLLPLVDVFLPSENEAMGIARTPDGPAAALDELARRYPTALVVVKLGADGCIAARGAERWTQPAFAVQVFDATGAGDAFAAGFLSRYARDRTDVAAALKAGSAAGAATVRRSGACVVPLVDADVRAFLDRA